MHRSKSLIKQSSGVSDEASTASPLKWRPPWSHADAKKKKKKKRGGIAEELKSGRPACYQNGPKTGMSRNKSSTLDSRAKSKAILKPSDSRECNPLDGSLPRKVPVHHQREGQISQGRPACQQLSGGQLALHLKKNSITRGPAGDHCWDSLSSKPSTSKWR